MFGIQIFPLGISENWQITFFILSFAFFIMFSEKFKERLICRLIYRNIEKWIYFKQFNQENKENVVALFFYYIENIESKQQPVVDKMPHLLSLGKNLADIKDFESIKK